MGYGRLKQKDVEIGRLYLAPIDVGAESPSPLLVTGVVSVNDNGFVYQTLDGKIQGGDSYDRPKGILLKEYKGKLDFLMGKSLLEQIAQTKSIK